MADLKRVADGGSPFSNESKIVRVEYDFAVDGGAQGLFDILKSDAVDDMVIKSGWLRVITTATSGGSMTLDAGAETGDPNGLLDAIAVASLVAGALIPFESTVPLKVPAGETVNMDINTADLTAGKFEFVMEVAKF